MHKLKYLEITNFKSYKGNYRIPFPSHFTCIIGPNGSGKSNILDAIVFCTTNKPYNVRNTTVKLVLTNGTEEMIFTRYINVNGKNSYFFNNKKVLYKEYIDNFIIYQAHTDLNISKIIDEISGSCIYRDEYDRLNREYTEILGKLKIESEARKQYLTVLKENKKYEEEVKKNLEMMDRKKELEMKLFDLKIYSLFVKYNKLNKIDYKKILEIRELKKQNETIKNQKSVIQGYVSDIQDKIDQKQDILDKLNTDINSLDEIKNPIEGFDDLEKEYYRVLNNGDINNEDDSLNSDPVLINLIKSKDDLELRNKSKIDEYTKVLNEEVECTNVLNNINNEILLNKNIKVKSVKMYNLKSKLKKINGVIGFIPDLVSCTNDKYTISVRSLLSKYESTLVVEDEECAVECIKYCKVNRLGRITCISLKNNFDNRNKSNRNNNDKNNLIDPILVIDYPSDVKSIIEYLFFNIFITDHSFQDLHTYPDNYDICTIDGILIKNKGRLIKYNSTIHEQVDDLVVRRIEILDKLDNIRTIKDKYNNIELIQERIKKIERDIENRKMILTKKELSPNIVESKVFKDIFIKNGYINYNDYITRNSKYYKEEKDLRKNVLLDKKNKLEKEIYKLNLEIDRLKEEDGKLVLKEVEDIEEYPILDVEGEKERILEEVKDLYFIEKNVVIEDLNNIFNDNYMKKIYKNIGDTKINTEDTKINTEDTKINTEDTKINTEDTKINTEDTKINTEDIKINTEDIKDYKIIIEYLNHELRNINNLLSSSSLLIKNTLKTDFNSDLYDTLKNKTFEIKGLLNTVRNKRNTLYLECIKSINESINILYSKILDGSCNLVVENKEDPFSGSVKYYVMVPNKKYKEYSYLSGGEQMISRIIFMYGVYQYRLNNSDKDKIIPSFILLDEVDSNLDNYNVNKLVQFIKNEDIQVVMVSLKVGVYKESDSMIGVYKREGKSNLLYYTY